MTCYLIAKNIMVRIRHAAGYHYGKHVECSKVTYYDDYDDCSSMEYFSLENNGIKVYIIRGEIERIEIKNPRGIILFNLRLWLLNIDRITK